jgi:phenylalanyl-tRNA synthetase beta chain
MMERGQPLHAFDLDLLVGREIVVRRAGADMEFVTLDGQPRRLTAEMLAICDGEMPVALGGVMGGHNSEVGAVTRNILLEAAHFDPVSIRRTSKSLKLSTEASIRFERGVDPEATIPALDRAAGMIQRAGGGNIQAGVVDCRESRLKQEKLSLRVSRASRLLGLDMSAAEVEKVLAGLGLPTEVGDDRVEVSVPSYRFDLKEEIDLVEEVARLIGYHKVPLAKLRLHGLPAGEKLLEQVFHKCRELLTSQGYLETINYSFIPPAQAAPFLEQGSQLVEISNPLSQEQSVMRPSLIPGLLESARRNVNRDLTDIRFFELGKVFWLSPGETGPQEGWRIVALGTGQRADRFWSQKQGKPHMFDFHDIKGAAENLLEGMGITGCRVRPADTYYLHEGVRAELLVGDKPVGVLGRVHPDILGSLGGLLLALSDMYLFELDLEEVAGSVPEKVTFAPLAKYPFLARDLAVVVKEEVVAEEVRDAIISLNADIIAEVSLFDLYRGEQVGPGKKSLAFSIKFQATDRTLTDKEVDATIDRAVATLADRFAASLRGGKEKER